MDVPDAVATWTVGRRAGYAPTRSPIAQGLVGVASHAGSCASSSCPRYYLSRRRRRAAPRRRRRRQRCRWPLATNADRRPKFRSQPSIAPRTARGRLMYRYYETLRVKILNACHILHTRVLGSRPREILSLSSRSMSSRLGARITSNLSRRHDAGSTDFHTTVGERRTWHRSGGHARTWPATSHVRSISFHRCTGRAPSSPLTSRMRTFAPANGW